MTMKTVRFNRHRMAVSGAAAGRAAAVIGASVAVLAVGQLPAAAATDPYPSGSSGYDVSYPQCPGTTAPSGSYGFAIVGVGGGRPFTSNSCAGAEAAAAAAAGISNVAYYFNTGYAGAYGRDISTTCSNDVSTGMDDGVFANLKGHVLSEDQKAWEIGCSEALYAQSITSTMPTPTMWWADIETGNSWSTNTALNDFVIDGLTYQMAAAGAPGGAGIYSYTSAWDRIAGTGSVPTPAENGNWLAFTGNFNSATPYLLQGGTTSSGIDTDTAY